MLIPRLHRDSRGSLFRLQPEPDNLARTGTGYGFLNFNASQMQNKEKGTPAKNSQKSISFKEFPAAF